MQKLLIAAVIAFVVYKVWKGNRTPYAGYVSTGWSAGNSQANLPALVNAGAVVGQPITSGTPAFGNSFVEQGAGGWSQ